MGSQNFAKIPYLQRGAISSISSSLTLLDDFKYVLGAANYRLMLNGLVPQSVNDLGSEKNKVTQKDKSVFYENSRLENYKYKSWMVSNEHSEVLRINVTISEKDTLWHFEKRDSYFNLIFEYKTKNDSLTQKLKHGLSNH